MRYRALRRSVLFAAAAVLVACCTAIPTSAQDIERYVTWSDSITLEEPEGIFTVSPDVRVDPQGGFIVTDSKESQVRFYDRSGTMKSSFGQRGKGPQGLTRPHAALRVDSNRILVPERRELSIFSEEGSYVDSYPGITAGQTYQIHRLPGDDILVVGSRQRTREASPLLHRFSVDEGKIKTSFFPHPVAPGTHDGYLFTILDIASAHVLGDRLVAVFSVVPRLYVYGIDGELQKKVDLPLEHFRPIEKSSQSLNTIQDVNAFADHHSRISDIFWLRENLVLIQYFDFVDVQSMRLRWNLAAVTLDGDVLFEVTDTPQLFAIDQDTQELFFSHPDYDHRNHWIVGKLRQDIASAGSTIDD